MADWRVAKSLDKLLLQINAKWPTRRKSSDGSIGDANHASRSSDHNPWVDDGVVTARDFTHDPEHGFDSYVFAEHLRKTKDPRIKYVISNHRIFSSVTDPWVWRPYGGANPHDQHVHVSVNSEQRLYDSVKDWSIGDGVVPSDQPPAADDKPLTKKGDTGYNVEYLQRMLGLPDKGVFDDATEAAVIEFQKRSGLVPDGKVGPYTWRILEAPGPDDEPGESPQVPPLTGGRVVFTQSGKMSTFGGPQDTGMSKTEGLALYGSEAAFAKAGIGDWLLSAKEAGAPGLGRRLDPTKFYLAARWDYKITAKTFLRTARIRVTNLKTGTNHIARAVDWGPNVRTKRAADLSPGLAKALGLETNDECVVEVFQ
jgi:hypothetical protein